MRSSVAIALGALGATTLAAGAAMVLLRGGISARAEPSVVEAALARKVRHLAIPASRRALVNPVPPGARILALGRAHFADHCASCHGNDGKGQTDLGRGLSPRAPDLTAPATQDLADGELFAIIEDGVRWTGMPAFGREGRATESWHLVHFVRHLPALSAEELGEMERMNPRSAAEWKELREEDEFLGEVPPDGEGRRN